MVEFDPEKFREAICKAKLYAYIVRSRDPEKNRLLEQLRTKMDEAQALMEKILEK